MGFLMIFVVFDLSIFRKHLVCLAERRREKAAMEFAREMLAVKDDEIDTKVQSSWGPCKFPNDCLMVSVA